MSKHNNIYNILGKLSALEPKPEPTKSILGELATPPKTDFARHLNERYLAEKDMGKHNNATTGFKALAKKAGGGEKGERIAGAQFQKMKKAGQLEERQVDEISDQLAYNVNQARAGQHFAAKDAADAAHKSWASGDNSSMKQAQNVSTTAQAARDAKSKLSRNTELQKSRGDRLGKQMYEPATGQSRSTPQSMGTADGGLTRMKKPAQQMNHTYEESLEMDEGWKGAIAGGIAGAGLGSVVPALGTVAGGIAGAYAGHKIGDQGISDPDKEWKSPKPKKPLNKPVADVDEDMLSPKQKKIAGLRPPPDKIDGKDLAALRGSKKTEGSKVDQNKDGKNDFEDVKIARMKASGAMKETANDEFAKARADKQSAEDDQWAASKGKGAGAEKVAGKAKNDKRDAQDRMWAAGKGVTEDSLDSHDDGEYDREGEMASQDLETAEDAAEELRSILDADENLPEWVQAKITKAVDYLDTARDYMQSKGQEPDLQEGWDDMMKSVKDRSEQGTGKFDKQVTSTGTRYTRKPETFSDEGDGETKASDAPKKNTGPERTTSKAWKHKGSRVSESKKPVKLDTFVEDTLAEMDAMLTTKKSVSQPQKFMGMVSESILLENTLQAIEHRYGKEVRDFMETGDLDDDLYHALYDYYFDDMPYGVKKARDGDPYEWIGDRFFDEMGGAGYLNRKDNSNGVEESGALHPGQVVYYRGQRGEIDRIDGNKCFVHVGDGDMDVWPTNSCSTEKQSFMSTMKNDIKDIGYGMKGFLTGGPETRELDELAKLAGLGQQKLGEAACNMTAEGEMCPKHGFAECWSSSMYESKGEKPDFLDADKDGDKEEPMKKAMDDKKKNPFGNKKELDECGMPSSMSPMGGMSPEAESGMNINSSMDTKTGRKTLSVTADGEAAEQLAQMLKMAGLAGGHSHEAEEPDHHKVVLIRPAGQEMEQPVEEEYANDPHEEYATNDAMMNQGQDLNRKKKQYAGMPKAGDNPMATEDAVRLEGKLARLYDSIKVRS